MAEFKKLDNHTKAVAAAWFGMMKPNSDNFLRFGLQQGGPSNVALRALNVLENQGLVRRELYEDGSMKYFPLTDFSPLFRLQMQGKLPGNVPLTRSA